MPNNQTGTISLCQVPPHPVSDRNEITGNTVPCVGLLKAPGHSARISQPSDIERQRVARICNELGRVRQQTDRYERMEIEGDFFPLIGDIRHWFRDNTRVEAVLGGLRDLAKHPNDVNGTA